LPRGRLRPDPRRAEDGQGQRSDDLGRDRGDPGETRRLEGEPPGQQGPAPDSVSTTAPPTSGPFAGAGGYESPSTFIDGMVPALWVGAIVVAVGALLAALIPRKRPAEGGRPLLG
jgi:hypothetical protein